MFRAPTHTHTYQLTAGESNAEGRMPLTLLTERVIEVATEHANSLGIGYSELIKHGIGWVLSRVTIEMTHWPIINEQYSITTWIEEVNRRFSDRNLEITNADGTEVMGYVRTAWAAINYGTRTGADLTAIAEEKFPCLDRPCPIERQRRIVAPSSDEAETRRYTFGYGDLDFNRHVNTVRYIALLLDCHTLEWHDMHQPARVEVAFHRECLYGQTVEIRHHTVGLFSTYEIVDLEGKKMFSGSIRWVETSNQSPTTTPLHT